MGQTPGEIRGDIERTRERMGAVIEAIGYRLDVPARVRYRFSHIVHGVGSALSSKPDGGNGHTGHNGGDTGAAGGGKESQLLASDEEKVGSVLHSAQGGISNVVGAAQERVAGVGQTVQSGLSDMKETAAKKVTHASDTAMTQAQENAQQIRDAALGGWRSLSGFARDNALALGAGALVLGVLAGLFIARDKGRGANRFARR